MTTDDTRAVLHALIDRLPDNDLDAARALIETEFARHDAPVDIEERRRRILEHAGRGHYPPGYLDGLRQEWPA